MSRKKAQKIVEQDPPLLELDQAQVPTESDNDDVAPAAEIEFEAPELAPVEEQVPELERAEPETLELKQAVEGEPVDIPVSSTAANDDASMDTVREILFGESLKAVRRELHLTVRNLRGSVKVMQHELSQRNDKLEEQLNLVQQALENESEQREALSDIVAEQMTQSSEQLKVKMTEQQDAVDVALKQFNADLELASNNQAHALEELEKKVFDALEEYSAEFRDGKMNRSDFADMLSSLAGKVSATDE